MHSKQLWTIVKIINFLFPRKKLKSIFLLMSFGKKDLEVTQYGVIIMTMNKINVFDYLSIIIPYLKTLR
jgi:hypothetical protein